MKKWIVYNGKDLSFCSIESNTPQIRTQLQLI